MSREVHVRFWEGVGVQLPHATRLFYGSINTLLQTAIKRLVAFY
jgi:hypothetical protein